MKHLLSYQKHGLFLTIFLCLLLLGSVISICHIFASGTDAVSDSAPLVATISRDGEILYEIPLTEVREPYDLTISSPDGGQNVIRVEHNGISMQSATCKDKLCVKTGKIQTSLLPIICLPNKVVIEVKRETQKTTYDSITY